MSHTQLAAAVAAAVQRLAADGGPPPEPKAGTGVPFKEAIDWHRQREPLTDEEWRKRQDWYRRRSFTVANVAQLDLVSDVHRAIENAVADGTTLDDFKKEIGERLQAAWGADVKNPAWRLEVIFRQGTLSAYGAGRYYQANDPTVLKRRPFWGLEVVVDDRTTKEICKPLVGTVLPANDPWWRVHVPPLHMLCRTALTTYTEEQAKKRGITAKPSMEPVQDGFGLAPDAIESDGPTGSRWYDEKLKRAPAELAEVAESKQSTSAVGRREAKPREGATPDDGGLTPSGTPVSKAVDVPQGQEHEPIRHAVRAVDEAHGDGDLPTVPAAVVPKMTGDTVGVFRALKAVAGKPMVIGGIEISGAGAFSEFNAVHEIGHAMDFLALSGQGRFASEVGTASLESVFAAIGASAAVVKLQNLAKRKRVRFTDSTGRTREASLGAIRRRVNYLLEPAELWARAYAQFVAVRSGDPILLGQLDALRAPVGVVDFHEQWDDDDFKPIKAEIETFMRSRGWLR